MNVSLKTFLPAVAAGMLTLTSCGGIVSRTKEYMADKTLMEYDSLVESCKYGNKSYDYDYTLMQSKLDSVAYRDIFNGTKAAKDSALVAEFNEIASSMRGYDVPGIKPWDKVGKIREQAVKQGIKAGEYASIKSKCGSRDVHDANVVQHYVDDWGLQKVL